MEPSSWAVTDMATSHNRYQIFRAPRIVVKRLICLLLFAACCSITACKSSPSPKDQENNYVQPTTQHHFNPTATEAFRLRFECVKLAQKILSDDSHGDAVTVDVRSNYDPDSNRCYVELDATTYDASKPNFGKPNYVTETRRGLYDGQTDDLLAYFINPLGDKQGSGMVFASHRTITNPNIRAPSLEDHDKQVEYLIAQDNYDVESFIDRAMGDDLPR
jgi:hypothetical protein